MKRQVEGSPSKHDHFHDATYFSTYVPKLNLEKPDAREFVRLDTERDRVGSPMRLVKPYTSYRSMRPAAPQAQSPRRRIHFKAPRYFVSRKVYRPSDDAAEKSTDTSALLGKAHALNPHMRKILCVRDGSALNTARFTQIDISVYFGKESSS
jgi:hypothetical protein